MLRRPLLIAGAALFLVMGAACTDGDDTPSTTATPTASPTATAGAGTEPGASPDPVTEDFLQNAVIATDMVKAGEVQLANGAHSEAAAPGSASMVEFVVDSTVIDDFDGDGTDDGAMIVRSSGGGSGSFYTLYVFLAAESGPMPVASELLGDRIEVQGIQSGPGKLAVEYLQRGADTPMSAPPDIAATRTVTFGLDGSITVSASGSGSASGSAGAGGGTSGSTGTVAPAPSGDACATLAPEAEEAAFVFVTNVTSGAYLADGTEVEGCSRTFESHVPWRLEDREGNVIAESFTMGGGVDGAAPFAFTVEYSVASAQVGHLFVGGDDPSDGEGFPPVTNQIPVVLLP